MELQDFIKLHEMKARAATTYDKDRNNVRTSVSYTSEEHEELVSMLKELQMYREREVLREQSRNGIKFDNPLFRISTVYNSSDFYHQYDYIFDDKNELQKFANGKPAKDRYGDMHTKSYYEFINNAEITANIDVESLRKNQFKDDNIYDFSRNIVQEQSFFPNNEVMVAAMKLQSCFRGSKFLYDADPIEFLANEKSNAYFIIGNCQTKEDVDCKVLEWLSRYAYKATPYQSKSSNDNFHESMLKGINNYLDTDFDKEDIEIIYTYLGNCYNHEKTLEFVRSGFDMDIFNRYEELEEI